MTLKCMNNLSAQDCESFSIILGFIGDIGFSFSGAENADNLEKGDWEAIPILIESVTRGSIAEKAGLEVGDEIIKVI